MKYLITGSKGFIGKNLCDELGRRGIQYHEADLPHIDIRNMSILYHVAATCDVVVHLAAISGLDDCEAAPEKAISTNVQGTLNVAQLGRRTIFASSGAVYGGDPGIYAMTKRLGERLCDVSLRFSNVFGPRSLHKKSAVHAFIQRALAGEPLEVHGDGSQVRDFIYVGDLVDAIILAAESDYHGALNVSSGFGHSILGVAKRISLLMDAEIQHAPGRPGDARESVLSRSEAEEALGWEPKTAFNDGLLQTIEWYRHEDTVADC